MQRERQRAAREKEKAAKITAADKATVASGKDKSRLEGRGLLELPPPVAAG